MNIINSIRTVLFSHEKRIYMQKDTRKVTIYDEEQKKCLNFGSMHKNAFLKNYCQL